MTDLSKATPRPWLADCFMIRAARDIICQTGYSSNLGPPRSHEAEANAALIVRAVNAHDELAALLKECRQRIAGDLEEDLDAACRHDQTGRIIRDSMDELSKPRIEDAEDFIAKIDATLAKVVP